MGAADLDDAGKLLRLGIERAVQLLERRDQVGDRLVRGSDVHGGGESVVRRLPHVAVIIGVNRALAALLAGENLVRAAGDHLVGVHVRLGAGAGLPHHQRELVGQRAVDHLARGLHDRLADPRIEHAELHVGLGRRKLLDAQRAHQRGRHALAADREIDNRTLRLRAPMDMRRNRHFTERIGFDPHILPVVGHVTHRTHPCVSRIQSRLIVRFPKHRWRTRSKPEMMQPRRRARNGAKTLEHAAGASKEGLTSCIVSLIQLSEQA